MSYDIRDPFETTGFAGPIPIFDREACQYLLELLRRTPPPIDWLKGHAVASRVYYELATHRAILDRVGELLGDDVMLWGASLVRRKPGMVHPWHTDVESSEATGRTATVWLGLSGTNSASSLRLVSHSHLSGRTVQELARRAGKQRDEITTQDVVGWAREHDPRSDLVQLAARDGDAVLFDGRLWHGSHNTNEQTPRTALLLQYATPDTPIAIPASRDFDWPFHFLATPSPPCIMVRGTGRTAANKLVPPPPPERGGRPLLTSRIQALDLPLGEDEQIGWKPYPVLHGQTRCMKDLSCHVSVLSPGKTPHEPHQHIEEELLLVLDGEAELVIVDGDSEGTRRTPTLRPGSFVYYPAWQRHTIHNASDRPTTYLMFKWRGDETEGKHTPLGTSIFDYGVPLAELEANREEGFRTGHVLDGSTRFLRRLRCHVSTLAPGAGYPPHADAYDVAIIVLRGTVETLGRRVDPHGVIFYSAGEPHGIENVGDTTASYLVFEFHGHGSGPRAVPARKRLRRRLMAPIRRIVPKRVRRLARKGLAFLLG